MKTEQEIIQELQDLGYHYIARDAKKFFSVILHYDTDLWAYPERPTSIGDGTMNSNGKSPYPIDSSLFTSITYLGGAVCIDGKNQKFDIKNIHDRDWCILKDGKINACILWEGEILLINDEAVVTPLRLYNDDLETVWNHNYDIMKIYRPMDYMQYHIKFYNQGALIFERH